MIVNMERYKVVLKIKPLPEKYPNYEIETTWSRKPYKTIKDALIGYNDLKNNRVMKSNERLVIEHIYT